MTAAVFVFSPAFQAALALNAGVDLEMGSTQWPAHLASAVRNGKTSEENVTRALKRALRPLFRAGRFDPVEHVAWAQLPVSTVNSSEHQARTEQDEGLLLGSWGKTTRDAVGNKEWWKGRHTPTQDPSTNNAKNPFLPRPGLC